MEKYRFRSAGKEVEINNTSSELNTQFEKLYASYFSGGVLRWQEFKDYAFLFFDNEGSEVEQARAFFQNFTVVCNQFLQQGEYDQVESIWQKSLDIVREWEEENDERLHKGTPYYFYGMACILNNEIEKGFLLMHNALEEDKVTRGTDDPDTPANYFVKLDPEQPAQAFRVKVIEVANFLKGYLEHCRNERGSNLNFQDFQDDFLNNKDLENTVFSFVYNLFQLKTSMQICRELPTDNAYSSLHQSNLLFSFCRIIENTIRPKYENAKEVKGSTFRPHLNYLSNKLNLQLSLNKLGEINGDQQNNFDQTISNLLSESYTFSDGGLITSTESDIGLAYCFRNFGAHNIKKYPVIYKNYEDISSRLLNVLFLTVEELY